MRSVFVFVAVVVVCAATAVVADAPKPVRPFSPSDLNANATLHAARAGGNSLTFAFNVTSATPGTWFPAINVTFGSNVEGWWIGDYAVPNRGSFTSPVEVYAATGFAQGYVEAQLLWDQWRHASNATYSRIALGRGATPADRWKGRLYSRLHSAFVNATFNARTPTSYESTVAKLRSLLVQRAAGHAQAMRDSAAAGAHAWLSGGVEALSSAQLFYMVVEPELLAAEEIARIETTPNVTYASYRPWMPAPAGAQWSNATARRFGGHCAVRHVVATNDYLMARVADAPFDIAMRRVMRTIHVESDPLTTTGTAGDYGASDAWHVTHKTTACGAPIRSLNPYVYSRVGAPERTTHRPTALARLYAALTATSAADFANKAKEHVLGIDATAWIIVDVAVAKPYVTVADVVAGDLSMIAAATDDRSNANAVAPGLWVAGGRPMTKEVRDVFRLRAAGSPPNCTWCNVSDLAFGYMYTNASQTNLAQATDAESMLRHVRAMASNWQSPPARPLPGVTQCAGLAPSPRFDLNPIFGGAASPTEAKARFIDQACTRTAYGAIDAKVLSTNLLRTNNASIIAVAGPTYEAPGTPAFDPNTYYCGRNPAPACVAALGYAHGPMAFAPLALPRPQSDLPRRHPSDDQDVSKTVEMLIYTFLTMAAVMLIFGGVCLATRPTPVVAPPSTMRPMSSLKVASRRTMGSGYVPVGDTSRGD